MNLAAVPAPEVVNRATASQPVGQGVAGSEAEPPTRQWVPRRAGSQGVDGTDDGAMPPPAKTVPKERSMQWLKTSSACASLSEKGGHVGRLLRDLARRGVTRPALALSTTAKLSSGRV